MSSCWDLVVTKTINKYNISTRRAGLIVWQIRRGGLGIALEWFQIDLFHRSFQIFLKCFRGFELLDPSDATAIISSSSSSSSDLDVLLLQSIFIFLPFMILC